MYELGETTGRMLDVFFESFSYTDRRPVIEWTKINTLFILSYPYFLSYFAHRLSE